MRYYRIASTTAHFLVSPSYRGAWFFAPSVLPIILSNALIVNSEYDNLGVVFLLDRIKELCAKRGITIAELERSCGIGNGIIARWRKSKPSFDRLKKVADFLEVTPEYLLTGEKEKPADQKADGNSEDSILFAAYKAAPENVQEAIRNLLGLK